MNDSVNRIEVIIEIEIVGPTDDSPPSFGKSQYTFSIREDAAIGTDIGDVEASDDGTLTKVCPQYVCAPISLWRERREGTGVGLC